MSRKIYNFLLVICYRFHMKMYSTASMETAEACRNSKLTIYFLRKNAYHSPLFFFWGGALYSEKPIIVHCFAQQVFASFIIVIINSIIIIIIIHSLSTIIIHHPYFWGSHSHSSSFAARSSSTTSSGRPRAPRELRRMRGWMRLLRRWLP